MRGTAKTRKKAKQDPSTRKQKTHPQRETHARTCCLQAGNDSWQLWGHGVLLPLVGWVAGARAAGQWRSGHRQAAGRICWEPKSWPGSLGVHQGARGATTQAPATCVRRQAACRSQNCELFYPPRPSPTRGIHRGLALFYCAC